MHPHLIHASLDPPESTSQTASRSVQRFLQGWAHGRDGQTDRQADHTTPCVTIGRIYVVLRYGLTSGQSNLTLECGPMPNVMVALRNIGGPLCSTPQSLARAQWYVYKYLVLLYIESSPFSLIALKPPSLASVCPLSYSLTGQLYRVPVLDLPCL